MTAPPTPEIIPQRASPVTVLRMFQRPLDSTVRPTIDDLSMIPTIIREQDRWVLWDYRNDKRGKPTKVPFQPHRPRLHAKVNDPTTLGSFDVAVRNMNGHAGLGCVVPPGMVYIDWDHVIVNGALPIWIQRILEQIRSYAEASPSGTGLHQITRGTLPGPGNKVGCLEMYDSNRYLTFTGNRLLSHPQTVEPVNVDQLHRLMVAGVFNFTKNPKLEKLLNGDHSDYPSQSEADMGFCAHLAGLGLGAEDIDRMVRFSGLYRNKWDEPHGAHTYGEMTIQAVLTSPPVRSMPASAVVVGSGGAWQNALLSNKGGKVQPLIANVLLVLTNDPKYQDLVAYDEFSGDIVLRRSAPWLSTVAVGSPWNDTCDSLLTAELQKDYGLALPTRIAAESLSTIAHQRSFHPVRDYLRSCVGDDKPRLNSWLPVYLGTEASP